jgi:NTP pyrophosphatase (non-canonical NTP hydrolase)
VSQRQLTVQDILMMRKQLQAADQLNNLLTEAVTEIGDAVNDLDLSSVRDERAALILAKVKSTLQKLERRVDEFTKRLK